MMLKRIKLQAALLFEFKILFLRNLISWKCLEVLKNKVIVRKLKLVPDSLSASNKILCFAIFKFIANDKKWNFANKFAEKCLKAEFSKPRFSYQKY